MTPSPADVAVVPDVPTATPRRATRAGRVAVHLLVWLLTLAIAGMAVYDGLGLRRWTWELCHDIHFQDDIRRGYGWGYAGSGPEGYRNLYDKMANQAPQWPLWLDYAPLRLGVMTVWAGHNRGVYPDAETWRQDYDFNWPILWFNAAMEGVGVLAAFFLVRRWMILRYRHLRRSRELARAVTVEKTREQARGYAGATDHLLPDASPVNCHPPFCGWASGLVAALLLWFNPAMIVSAHGWPTWDVWIVPMYLLALLCASYRCWLLAGVAMGIGAMFKGQQFIGVPVFIAWPLLLGDWRAALRFISGVVIAIVAVASPWLLTYVPAGELEKLYHAQSNVLQRSDSRSFAQFAPQRLWNWIALAWAAGVAIIAAALPFARRPFEERWNSLAVWTGSTIVAAAMVLWPAVRLQDPVLAAALACGFAMLGIGCLLVRRVGSRIVLTVTAFAVALLAGMWLFGASDAWWKCGIAYGTDHFRGMTVGPTDNLPGLLAERWGFRSIEDDALTLPWFADAAGKPQIAVFSIRIVMRSLFALFTIPFLWAIARHARRDDPRFLIAVAGPWMMFFCLPTEIHERYLLYAAAVSSIWIGQSVGMTLLGVGLTVFTWLQSMHVMLSPRGCDVAFGRTLHAWQPDWFSPGAGVTLHRFLDQSHPDAAWAILLAGAVILWMAMTKSGPRVRGPLELYQTGET